MENHRPHVSPPDEPPFHDEPIALVGMGCRFAPDLTTLDAFWSHLSAGRVSVGEVPGQRWEPYASAGPQTAGVLRRATRFGAFLDDAAGFDAAFFDIPPREAESVDPQQRILLEVAWEALEHAGIPVRTLRGTDAGVFMAANSYDYGRLLLEDIPRVEAWAINGGHFFGIANRISYVLDLRGPSMAVDTACSGSLTALHLACQSLWRRETELALVGGVNIMAGPGIIVALDAAGATSPDGRSKPFDQDADGYGRGEGAGAVVLKRLSRAQRDGDRVLAVVRGSGVFQDGGTDGMMLPNGPAQQHMLHRVYERAGIPPATVDLVEAHGTGTPAGDRAEARALARVFGAGRAAGRPCLIGSVKANIGHLEAGAGIAGLIKVVLALRHGRIPSSPHREPARFLDWDASGLRLAGQFMPWPGTTGHPRRAGVSSYGMGGTLAHSIVEEAPAPGPSPRRRAARTAPAQADTRLLPLSSATEAGLRALAARTADWLAARPDTSLPDVAHTLSLRRSHLRHRAAVLADTPEELRKRLSSVADGARAPGVTTGTAPEEHTDPVWVFSGHGAQWPGMGRQLLNAEPAFRAVLEQMAPVFREELGYTPQEAIAEGDWADVSRVQAMTFALQVGLAAVWREKGLRPGAVLGHSVGEISAAAVAGALGTEEAARFACRRARVVRRGAGTGGMAMVNLPFDEVVRRLAHQTEVAAAVAASPVWTVVSGADGKLRAVCDAWRESGAVVRVVKTDVAFHSPLMDPLTGEVAAAADCLTPRRPEVPLYSTVTDSPRSTADRNGAYWAAMLREPVRFAPAVRAALADGHRLFLEISSHPIVAQSVAETLDDLRAEEGMVAHSTRRDEPEQHTLLANLGALHCHGAAVDWSRLQPGGRLTDLPTMAWQHREYWRSPAPGKAVSGGGHDPAGHTLLGARTVVGGAAPLRVWQTHLDFSCRPYPGEHPVHGTEIVPAAVLLNTLCTAGAQGTSLPVLTDVRLRLPVAVGSPRTVQVVLHEGSARIASRLADADNGDGEPGAADDALSWVTHTTAVLGRSPDTPRRQFEDPAALRARCGEEWPWERIEELYRRRGVGGYGFPWRVEELRRGREEIFARLSVPVDSAGGTGGGGGWAPLLDGALTLTPLLLPDDDVLRMPAHIRRAGLHGEPAGEVLVHARLAGEPSRNTVHTVDLTVADSRGRVIADVAGLQFGELQGRPGRTVTPGHLVHELRWRPLGRDGAFGTAPPRAAVLVGEADGPAGEIREELAGLGVRCAVAATPEDAAALAAAEPSDVLLVPSPAAEEDTPAAAASAEAHVWSLIRTAQCLADTGVPGARLWSLTRGVRDGADGTALTHAPLWGASRIIAGEHPELWGGVVDLAAGGARSAAGTGRRLLEILRSGPGEDVIALAPEGEYVARLAPAGGTAEQTAPEPARLRSTACRPDGTYLITGGLGTLGLDVARWLVGRGARRLVLIGRQGLPPRHQWHACADETARARIEAVQALEALGATVRVLALDIADHDAVAAALDPAALDMPPVRGLVHAAAVLRDGRVDETAREMLADVMRAKAGGAMVLHRLFPPGSVDFFVLFSSCGQYGQPTGQTGYAAANSFLDALAARRQHAGHPETLSLGWMTWRDTQQDAQTPSSHDSSTLEVNDRGMGAISPAEAFGAWLFAARYTSSPYVAVLRPLPLPPQAPRLPVLAELTAVGEDTDAGPSAGTVFGGAAGPTGLSPEALREQLTGDLRAQVAAELGAAPEDIELKRPLSEMGIDSVMTVALRIRLRRRYGVDLPPTILWNRPTIGALAAHLAGRLAAPESESAAPARGEKA